MKKVLFLMTVAIILIGCERETVLSQEVTNEIKEEIDMAVLPITGISTSMIREALSENTNNVGGLCNSNKVNRWSKRKPHVDTRIAKNFSKYWRTSDVSPYIRSGLYIPYQYDSIWEYPRNGMTYPNRLGDFRGYEHNGEPETYLNMNNQFTLDYPYEVTYLFNGEESDTGLISLQDIFDLENKYVCLALEMSNVRGRNILKYSDRIMYNSEASMYGVNITLSPTEVEYITDLAGTIYVKVYMIEAREMIAGELQDIKKYSIRHKEEVVTSFYNRQFLALGFYVYGNFDTVEPYKSGTYITSTGQEQVVVSSDGKTGGTFTGHMFQAKIIGGNQIGPNHVYTLPTYTLGANQTEIMYIPEFTLQMLQAGEAKVEYSVWNGQPEASDLIFLHVHNLQ